jgi:hypothetical protein
MNNKIKYLLVASLGFFLLLSCGKATEQNPNNPKSSSSVQNILDAVQESEKYTTKDSVAAYISKFKKLPSNYVNKATGQLMYKEKGYVFSKWNFNPLQVLGVMIGGDYFGNNEGLLPNNNYKECDVDYHNSSRGTKRLVYTNTGIVYYTANHYVTFTPIYK